MAPLTPPPRIPNLIGLSNEDKTAFTQDLEHRLAPLHSDLHSLPAHVDTHMLTSLANRLNELTHDSAYHKLPLTSAPSFQNKSTLLLQRQRRDLTRLLHIASDLTAQGKRFTLCPAWIQIYQRCLHSHLITWTVNASHLTPSESHVWEKEQTTHSFVKHVPLYDVKGRRCNTSSLTSLMQTRLLQYIECSKDFMMVHYSQ